MIMINNKNMYLNKNLIIKTNKIETARFECFLRVLCFTKMTHRQVAIHTL